MECSIGGKTSYVVCFSSSTEIELILLISVCSIRIVVIVACSIRSSYSNALKWVLT